MSNNLASSSTTTEVVDSGEVEKKEQQKNTEYCISSQPKANEGCLDYLVHELVHYSSTTTNNPSAAHFKLERIGFRIGQQLVERYTQDRTTPFSKDLDKVKFLCKDFWTTVFKKQIDNLRTNHRGVFVLHDARFRWLLPLQGPNAKEAAINYIQFPCGLIRGALAVLDLHCSVTAEIQLIPACTFTLKNTTGN